MEKHICQKEKKKEKKKEKRGKKNSSVCVKGNIITQISQAKSWYVYKLNFGVCYTYVTKFSLF